MKRILLAALAVFALITGYAGKYAIASFPPLPLANAQVGAAPRPTLTGGGCVVSGANGYLGFTNCAALAPTPAPTATPFPGAIVPTPAATGDMLYSANGTTWVVLSIGTSGQCLKPEGSPLVPTWTTC